MRKTVKFSQACVGFTFFVGRVAFHKLDSSRARNLKTMDVLPFKGDEPVRVEVA